MQPGHLLDLAITPAHALLSELSGAPLHGDRADVLSLAIAIQESDGLARAQRGGPARSYWQFEKAGGFYGVLNHARTKVLAVTLAKELDLPTSAEDLWVTFPYNDLLGAGFARLLIYSDNAPLPLYGDQGAAWSYYLRNWRPGKPRPDAWNRSYQIAKRTVDATNGTALPQATVPPPEPKPNPYVTDALGYLRQAAQLLERAA